ncbi:OPT family oligopeptide transporter [Corynebacterium anserum]|uniref:Oligopeptide transporter, OPT family n=1 Tax=Corynebacterium anserum TaxID=2684406 RepID=A0A7G7YNZ4_9CORY|nr:oligopeptide transporter, OPT family [Corynebacterium anserum]MBC2681815.1 oligopeptide transporter, OPT family [Corynebacterium anserum]QNH96214.1 oligopeptide transporter, OPT family [Corynebacterium anserum]
MTQSTPSATPGATHTAPTGAAGSTPRQNPIRELTFRAIILGGIITLVFTAANVYLGLKVGLTFATSIPAAVISMAILRKFAHHSIVENNIVQTIASAAGTLSAIIFVLPGLIMIGFWSGFPYWTTAFICAIGGILGVTYSIPLRRALVTGSDLPYPEGVAAGEVLKVGDEQGSAEENKRGLHVIIAGSLASAGFSLLAAMKAAAGSLTSYFKLGAGATTISASLSLALIGVGHLVGMSVGIAMIVGLVISFGVLLPMKTAGLVDGGTALADVVDGTFSADVRFIGAGAMAVAAVWTLLKIIAPIAKGIKESLASSRARHDGKEVDITERDIPFPIVAGVTLASMIPVGLLLWLFVKDTEIMHHTTSLVLLSIVYVLLVGLIVASICGYMAGLIGASNSPISGVGIIVVLSAALLIKAVTGNESEVHPEALVAYTLFTAAVVFGIATISNDNLQDLKTGQIVGATPWKQQVALIIGVLFGSAIIPPVLQLMMKGFGFAGAPGAGPDALASPQAALLSSVANGIFGNSLDWSLIGLGALIGIGVIIVDEILRKTSRFSLPPLAVGMGMYLPISLTLIIPLGALLGLLYNRWSQKQSNPESSTRLGVLVATGLIVGESLFGVLNAGIIAASGNGDALAVFPASWTPVANWLGPIVFAVLIGWCYRYVQRKATETKG